MAALVRGQPFPLDQVNPELLSIVMDLRTLPFGPPKGWRTQPKVEGREVKEDMGRFIAPGAGIFNQALIILKTCV
jgi:hypothetical protein